MTAIRELNLTMAQNLSFLEIHTAFRVNSVLFEYDPLLTSLRKGMTLEFSDVQNEYFV